MKKNWVRILALCLVLLLPALALAEARYPAKGEAVVDDANVLSEGMLRDVTEYADEMDDEADVKLHVVLVDFLDGLDAQTYASNLFARWGLGKEDFLLLGAAGEDSFASVSGDEVREKLSDNNAQKLLYSSGFADAFKAQQYDLAFAKYFISLTDMVNKYFDADVEVGKLFSDYQQPAQTAPSIGQSVAQAAQSAQNAGSAIWNEVMQSINDSVNDYNDYHERRQSEGGSGLSPKGWIVLGIIALIVFSQSDPARKARRKHGCNPLTWIFAGWGIGSLLNHRHGRHGRW